jgi:hypothetical protein
LFFDRRIRGGERPVNVREDEGGTPFDNRWYAIPRIDPNGRPYPAELVLHIAKRMEEEGTGYEATKRMALEEIALWEARKEGDGRAGSAD